ncbi:efflux RND transporter periplasmic adaptor subunit [Jannaschia seohaensis]|uniref:Membrane fusion protein, multidrug efflux system n=1 Tax=Jannaschia seohaensis TaxID=475081 RepID=A0A2Y9BXW9_9RHOB|nr:efflux RND transporter periplasmic adaptor subunit [Jannaschia seohaensis]PWJ21172.1 multidrug efflux system membrane fusion protein [Jannaschia seohaensis]SSA41582.1 membrane fusion protein, multidrug efflux system [Jannaschia seohaensis]
MRFFPLLTAALVCVALFFLVLQRETLLDFARSLGGGAPVEEVAETGETAETGPVAIATVEAAQADETVHVIALRSEAREVPDAVMVRGQSEAAREVEVRAETTGIVISEPLRKGRFVEAGQLLCEIDPGSRAATLAEAEARLAAARAAVPEAQARVPEAQARVAEAEARLEEARINQNAASRLSEGGFASETRVANAAAALRAAEAALTAAATGLETVQAGIEAASANVQTAEAGVERASQDIDKLSIEAPFSGLLETDTAELGALLQPGSPCATVIQLDPMKLVGFLPEAQVDRVEVGARAGARLASGGDVAGEVTFLSRSADDMTRTFRVEVTVPNPNLAIRDGQTAEILIETEASRAHLVPASALTLNDSGTLGLRIVGEDGIVGFAPATIVRDTQDGVLLSGLPERVDVIVVGQEYVTEGVPVRATFEPLGALRETAEATQ